MENVHSELEIKVPWYRKYLFWVQVTIYAMLLLAGQSVGTLLTNLYYDNGGKSNWLATLLSNVGFPLIIPFVFISPAKRDNEETNNSMRWSWIIVSVYVFLGLLLAVTSMLSSIGLRNLTVSTYALISASQLTFNAIFSVIFNGEILTIPILNSLVLLTLSSVLLVFQDDSEDDKNTEDKNFAVGFICTLAGSACYSLMLSLTELTFQKVFRRQNFKVIVDMSIYQCLVATIAILIGLFASGDWKSLGMEMENFKGGKTAYIMSLFWIALSWQLYTIGCLGLILKVSSLFSNAISVVGCPLAPVFAVIFLKEKVTGIKVISLLLAIWGLLSYGYQNYLDDLNNREESKSSPLPSTSTETVSC